MERGVRLRTRGVAVAAAVALATGLAAEAQVLRYIETSKPEVLNPIEGYRDVVGVRIMELLFRGLLCQDENGNWAPELADAVPPFTPGDQELVVHLRPGLRWPDGQPLTAQDVAFSFDVYMHPRNNYANRNIYEIFESVEAIDSESVRIRLRYSHPEALHRLGFAIMPQHLLLRPVLDPQHGYSRQPMGAGPYAVTYYEENLLRFGRNASYPGEPAKIDSIELDVNASDAVHTALLLVGKVDLDPVVKPQDLPEVSANSRTAIRRYDSNEWSGFAHNATHPVLRFKEVRQALTYMFDRETSLRANFGDGAGVVVSGPYTPSSFCVDPDIEPRPYDSEQAVRLLEEVNLLDLDDDGVREYEGQPVRLRMVLSKSMSQANKDVCQDFARQVGEHGIRVDLDYQESRVWRERVFFDHDYDITFITWKFDDASNVYPLFSLTQMAPGMYNITQFAHDGVEELLDRFRRTTDDAERGQIGRRLHALLYEEMPYTFLWKVDHAAGYRIDLITKIAIDPFTFFRSVEEWEMAGR